MGFAIVASEIKNLSEQTSKATRKISDQYVLGSRKGRNNQCQYDYLQNFSLGIFQ